MNLDEINKVLKTKFGTTLDGRSKWRLIWSESEDALEHRKGVFNRFNDLNFESFKREEAGIFKEKKYPWIGDRYLLEELVYQPSPDLPDTLKGHYELVYITQDGKGNYLPPKLEVYEAIIYFKIQGNAVVKTDWAAYFERQSQDYKGWVKNVMEENYPMLSHQREAGEAVFLNSATGNGKLVNGES